MNPLSVPERAKAARPYCKVVSMGPPVGVKDEDCGTVEMLIGADSEIIGYSTGRANYAYYRPSLGELSDLKRGGFIEFAQYGPTVQPFSAVVWAAPSTPQGEEA